MDEDFKDVIENSRKVGIIFTLFIIGLFVAGYYFVFRPIYFSVKTVEIELGSELPEDIEYYISNFGGKVSDYEINLSKVKTEEIGEYSYTVTNQKLTKKGTIKVVDTTAPKFTLQEMTVEAGDIDYYLGDFLETCEDASKPCLVTLKNEKDESKFNEVGKHTVEIEVSDVYGNKSSSKATLNVVESGTYVDPRTLDLEYVSNSKNIENFKGTIYLKLERALNSQDDEARDQMSDISTVDLEAYVRDNYEGYRLVSSEIIELYNKSMYVIGYSIQLTISNGKEMVVYVDPSKTKVTEPIVDSGTTENDDGNIE